VFAAKIAIAALNAKKHVLCEKPLGMNAREVRAVVMAARKNRRLLKVGFNKHFHPGIARAKRLFDQGVIGKLAFIRARYGHGGRKGMEKEWRMNPKISGGGELIDQGVHLIDLIHWFAGDFESVYCVLDTKVWRAKVEDNAFVTLTGKKATGFLHASTTNWGNIFSFEVFGERGYLIVEGLGGWYGPEILKIGKRKEKFGDVVLKEVSFAGQRDVSWENEWKNFIGAIQGKNALESPGEEGWYASEVVDAAYRSAKSGRAVRLAKRS
jgi:predicted dehydrogenase